MCRALPEEPVLATHPVLNAIASKHNKTPAQVARQFYLYVAHMVFSNNV